MSEFIGIHFGCGGFLIPDFQNFDIELDLTKPPFPFADNSVDVCFASHVMEHVSGPQALRFLDDCYRMLKPGGICRVSIPVIGEWLDIGHARDLCLGHGHLCVWNEASLRAMFWMAGFSQSKIRRVDRHPEWDHHHKQIGEEKDAIESCRILAIK